MNLIKYFLLAYMFYFCGTLLPMEELPFIVDIIPTIAPHLNLFDLSQLLSTCSTYNKYNIEYLLQTYPIICHHLYLDDHIKALVFYAQNNNLTLFKRIIENENNNNKENRLNILIFFDYISDKCVDLVDLANIEKNMLAYKAINNNQDKMSPIKFITAICAGNHNIVKIFFKNNIDISYKNAQGDTALSLALLFQQKFFALELLKRTQNVNYCDNLKITLLHQAVWFGSTKIVKILLEKGAFVNGKDNVEDTPLHDAIRQGHTKIAKILIATADINAQNNRGLTPLHMASNKEMSLVILLLRYKAQVNAQSKTGRTPLHRAAWYNKKKIAKILINNFADINIQDQYGDTPLHDAVFKKSSKVERLLLKNHASTFIKNNAGFTPLEWKEHWHNQCYN